MFKIKCKDSGKFFNGFDSKGRVLWSAKGKAMTHLTAKGQAACLICAGYNAQRKPVAA